MDLDDLPSFDTLISDALAMGYEVVAYIIDDEGQTFKVKSHGNEGKNLTNAVHVDSEVNVIENWNDDSEWLRSLENIHGGRIISEEEIYAEENFNPELTYEKMSNQQINEWIRHYEEELLSIEGEDESYIPVYEEQIEMAKSELESRHDTWFNPGEEPLDIDSACYCGWLGNSQPLPEFKPPGCNCVTDTDTDTDFQIGTCVGNVEFKLKEE